MAEPPSHTMPTPRERSLSPPVAQPLQVSEPHLLHDHSVSSLPTTRLHSASSAALNAGHVSTSHIITTTTTNNRNRNSNRAHSPPRRRDPTAAKTRRGLRSKSPTRTTTAPVTTTTTTSSSSISRNKASDHGIPLRATTAPPKTNILDEEDDVHPLSFTSSNDDDGIPPPRHTGSRLSASSSNTISASIEDSSARRNARRTGRSRSPVRRTRTPQQEGSTVDTTLTTGPSNRSIATDQSKSPLRRTRTQTPPMIAKERHQQDATVITTRSKSPIRRTRTQAPAESSVRSLSPRRGLAQKSALSQEQADMEAKQRAKQQQQQQQQQQTHSMDTMPPPPMMMLSRAVTEFAAPSSSMVGAHSAQLHPSGLRGEGGGGSARSMNSTNTTNAHPHHGLSRQDWHAKFGGGGRNDGSQQSGGGTMDDSSRMTNHDNSYRRRQTRMHNTNHTPTSSLGTQPTVQRAVSDGTELVERKPKTTMVQRAVSDGTAVAGAVPVDAAQAAVPPQSTSSRGLSRQDWHAKFGGRPSDPSQRSQTMETSPSGGDGDAWNVEEEVKEEVDAADSDCHDVPTTNSNDDIEQQEMPGVQMHSAESTRRMMHRKADELFASTTSDPDQNPRSSLTTSVLRNSMTHNPPELAHLVTTSTSSVPSPAASVSNSVPESTVWRHQEGSVRQNTSTLLPSTASSGARTSNGTTSTAANTSTMLVQPSISPPLSPIGMGEDEDRKLTEDEGMSNKAKIVVAITCLLLVVVMIVVVVVVATRGESQATDSTSSFSMMELAETVFSTVPNVTVAALEQNDDRLPQSKALVWLSEDPNRSSYAPWRLSQLFALATLYYSLSGPQWQISSRRDSWLQYGGNHGCDWNPVKCDDNGQVLAFPFTTVDKGMKGVLVPEISLLPELKTINIVAEDLDVTLEEFIPLQIVELSSTLQILKCNDCGLNGTIPVYLGKVSNLRRLELARNQLSGTLPSHLFELNQLTQLVLGDNKLEGSLSTELGLLTSLTVLDLGHPATEGTANIVAPNQDEIPRYTDGNSLSGPLPSTLGYLTELTSLVLGDNLLSSALPTELGRLSKMETIEAQHNQLSGAIPSELGLWTATKKLSLYDNMISGPIPSTFGNMMSTSTSDQGTVVLSLQELQLQNNQLTSVLPSELGQLKDLYILLVRGNPGLLPPIPAEICNIGEALFTSNFQTDWCGLVVNNVPNLCCSAKK